MKKINKDNKPPLEIALDILFKRRKQLLEDYEHICMNMSLSETNFLERDLQLYNKLERTHNDVQFICRLINMIRRQTSYGSIGGCSQ